MPGIYFNLLKMSLISRLFVFIALWGFTFYYLILCFIPFDTRVLNRYAFGNSCFLQKCFNICHNFKNAASKITHIVFGWEQFLRFCLKQFKYCLQELLYSTKQAKQCLKVRSDYPNIQKSFKKQSQALKTYATSQLLPIFQGRYCSFFNLNPNL